MSRKPETIAFWRGRLPHWEVAEGRYFVTIHLAGAMDASGSEPDYQMNVQVTNAAPSALAGVFDERWGNGLANVSVQLEMSGYDTQDLAKSATGTVRWDWTKGGLAADDPLPVAAQPFAHFDQWNGEGTIGDRSVVITHSRLDRGQEAIPLTGTNKIDRAALAALLKEEVSNDRRNQAE